MERVVFHQLTEWKNRADRKPLILNGPRQVGKTWLLRELPKENTKKKHMSYVEKTNLLDRYSPKILI